MKTKIILALCCFVFSIASAFAQDKTTETIKVYGNCEMCKEKIEGALKKQDGVISKRWDQATLMLTVTFDPVKITINQIGEKIAAVGYDNQYATATDASYNQLHPCCKYVRPEKEE